MTKDERARLASLAEEIRIIHQALKDRYKGHICLHDGYLYHITRRHRHRNKKKDYMLIIDDEHETPAQIALYNPDVAVGRLGFPKYVGELQWTDPNLFKRIFRHCDKFLL